MENMETIIMNLVVEAGDARSSAMEAIHHAKAGEFGEADKLLARSEEQIGKAHQVQTELIQQEVRGEQVSVSLFLVHAQDHLMNAATVRDLARELVDLYRRLGASQ